MAKVSAKAALSLVLVGLLILAAKPVQAGSVNKGVHVEAGATRSEASSVNGSVSIGADALVDGPVSTVNGSIRVDERARVGEVSAVNGSLRVADKVESGNLSTVNGAIRIAASVAVAGHIESVNGLIEAGPGTTVADDVSNVNGKIELVAADISGDLSTVNGDVELWEGTVLRGDLIVEKPGGIGWSFRKQRVPTIVIGPDSRVLGSIRLEREVKLFVSETAEITAVEGELSMDDAVRFSGKRP